MNTIYKIDYRKLGGDIQIVHNCNSRKDAAELALASLLDYMITHNLTQSYLDARSYTIAHTDNICTVIVQ